MKENPKAFYSFAKSRQKTKTKIGPLKTQHGGKPHFESDPQKMAELLSNQYKSVFTTPKLQGPPINQMKIYSHLKNGKKDTSINSKSKKEILLTFRKKNAPGGTFELKDSPRDFEDLINKVEE